MIMRRLHFRARVRICSLSVIFITALAATGCSGSTTRGARRAPALAANAYIAYVASEASDIVSRVRFTPGGEAVVERMTGVGEPGRIVGPHGIALSSDGAYWFVSLSHGIPTGRIARYTTGADSVDRRVHVGPFPETITHNGDYLFVTNSDASAGASVGSVSILFAATLTEVARPATCVKPRGGRIGSDTRHYSVCESSDQLVAIDTRTLQVSHRFSVMPGQAKSLGLDVRGGGPGGGRGCVPAWAEPGRGGKTGFVYVACSRTNEILEVDVRAWTLTRRFATSGPPHHLAVDASGSTLFATMHEDSAVAVLDLASGAQRARIPTSQAAPHGVVITRDNRYAFVTNEGAGSARGTLDIIDVATLQRVSSIPIGYGAGALDVMSIRLIAR